MTKTPFLETSFSPLRIRESVREIRGQCVDRRRVAWDLLWPVPWHLRLPAPISVDELSRPSESRITVSRQANILPLHNVPLFRARDTALRSLYRLYEDMVSRDLIMMGYECEYLFRHSGKRWRLGSIPRPKGDADPVRVAILASLIEVLVDAFNWRMERGQRRSRKAATSEELDNALDDDLDADPPRVVGLEDEPLEDTNESGEPPVGHDGGGEHGRHSPGGQGRRSLSQRFSLTSSIKRLSKVGPSRPRSHSNEHGNPNHSHANYTPEMVPSWVDGVAPLPELLDLKHATSRGTSWHFQKRNIKASVAHFYRM